MITAEVKHLSELISDFAEYLNLEGFSVTPEKIIRLVTVCDGQNIDVVDEENLLSAMKTVFCSSAEEVFLLPRLFRSYWKNKERVRENKKNKKELDELLCKKKAVNETRKKLLDDRENAVAEIKRKAYNEEKRIREELEKRDSAAFPPVLSKTDLQKIQKRKDIISEIGSKLLVKGLLEGNITEFSPEEITAAEKELVESAKKAILKKDMEKLAAYKDLQSILNKSAKTIKKNADDSAMQKKRDAEVKKLIKPYDEQIIRIYEEYDKKLHTHWEKQVELDHEINTLNTKIGSNPEEVEKEAALTHRDTFIGGGAVRAFNAVPEFAKKQMSKLTENEEFMLRQFLLENLLRFKTRLTRNVATLERRNIDIQRTIQYACKTGGLPMQLHYTEQRPSKSNLMLILDVSGSCAASSSMMLTFMYYLQSVFPRGCKAFAFVDSLYDITSLMSADDPDIAIKAAFNKIPVKGVYSNYEVPLRTLWTKHKKDITKDTMIIFMGDARNNKNQTGEYELKNICRKAKCAYWLNTEKTAKWDKMDSIASLYGKYAKMYETTTPADLLWFIQEGLK